jgi:hypothetical protein
MVDRLQGVCQTGRVRYMMVLMPDQPWMRHIKVQLSDIWIPGLSSCTGLSDRLRVSQPSIKHNKPLR